jgi:hypothetical protein
MNYMNMNYRCYQIITLRVKLFFKISGAVRNVDWKYMIGPCLFLFFFFSEYKTVEGTGTDGVGSVVSILTTLRPERSALRISIETRDISPIQNVDTGSGAHPAPSQQAPRVIFTEIKLPGCKVGHPPPYSSELRRTGDVLLLPLHAFTAWAGRTSR